MKLGTILRLIRGFLAGAFVLNVFALLEKTALGTDPLTLNGIVVPTLFGGIAGAIVAHLFHEKADKATELALVNEEISREMAERKKSEEGSRNSERRYRELVNKANDIIFQIDLNGFFTFVNPVALRSFGYLEEEVIGKHYLEFIDPKYREQAERFYGIQCEQRAPETYHEYPARTKRGETVWLGQKTQLLQEGDSIVGFQSIARDITERKTTEDALRANEEILKDFLDHANDLIQIVDPNGRFLFVNHSWRQTLGYSEDDLERLSIFDIIHSDSISHCKVVFDRVMSGESVSNVEAIFIAKDGKPIVVEGDVNCRYEKGKPVHTRGIFRNVTKRKQAEKALKESEAKYRELFENANVAILVAQDNKIKLVNPVAVELTGYSSEELTSKPFMDFVHPDDLNMMLNRHQRRLKGEHPPDSYAYRVFDKEGKTRWMEVKVKAIEWEGRPAILVFALDSTERKQVEETLRESEEFNRRLVEHSPMAIIYLDAEGILEYTNPASNRIFGIPDGQESPLVGLNILDLPVIAQQAHLAQGFRRLMQGEHLSEMETPYRSPLTGRDYTLLVSAAPRLAPEGSVVGAIVMFLDITERKRLQDQLLQAQKMEAVGTLAGGVAHDFNNLLQVIMGYSDILAMTKDSGDPERKKLLAIRQAAERGSDLAKSLLTFSRKVEIKARPIDMRREIGRVQEVLYRTIPKMIEIELHLAEDLNTVDVDPGQMEQLLLNLAINARDAMPEGGRLTIAAENAKRPEDFDKTPLEGESGEYVLLTISDTGHGMEQEVLDRIFEPFYTTKGPGEGTGLGLAMVFGIVQSHRGHIACDSEPGVGTTFKIYLPVTKIGLGADMAATADMPAFGTETILLVEDEDTIRDVGKKMLGAAGYNVLTARNGQEALEIYRINGPDIALVILDLIMPKMGGKQCLQELLEIDPNAKVIIASGYSGNVPAIDVGGVGPRGFISKPFDTRELLMTIRKVLEDD